MIYCIYECDYFVVRYSEQGRRFGSAGEVLHLQNRKGKDRDMKFSEMPYERVEFDKVKEEFFTIMEASKAAKSGEEQFEIHKKYYALTNRVTSMMTIAHIRHDGYTEDEFYKAEQEGNSPPATAVHSEKTTETKVYSFSGSDEVLAVMNGTVILDEEEETFSGGTLQVNSEDFFEGVTSYSTTFYILKDGKKKTVMSNSLTDQTGGKIKLDGDDLGKISGADIITEYKTDNTENLINNLYFHINMVGADGENKTHQLHLDVTEVN